MWKKRREMLFGEDWSCLRGAKTFVTVPVGGVLICASLHFQYPYKVFWRGSRMESAIFNIVEEWKTNHVKFGRRTLTIANIQLKKSMHCTFTLSILNDEHSDQFWYGIFRVKLNTQERKKILQKKRLVWYRGGVIINDLLFNRYKFENWTTKKKRFSWWDHRSRRQWGGDAKRVLKKRPEETRERERMEEGGFRAAHSPCGCVFFFSHAVVSYKVVHKSPHNIQ